jgi:hypothetical protein
VQGRYRCLNWNPIALELGKVDSFDQIIRLGISIESLLSSILFLEQGKYRYLNWNPIALELGKVDSFDHISLQDTNTENLQSSKQF